MKRLVALTLLHLYGAAAVARVAQHEHGGAAARSRLGPRT